MWKLIFGSVQGTSHIQLGLPCQDYCSGTVCGAKLVVACADGAGSAELSQWGAKAAVDRFIEVVSRHSGNEAPTNEQVEEWVHCAREGVLEEVVARQSTPRQLACTFLGALVGHNWAAFAQIGDGAIIFDGSDRFNLAFWPENGEYANTTRFLSDGDYGQHLRVDVIHRHVSELALLTDGLQMLALDIAQLKVHDRFFTPLFETVRNGSDEATLQHAMMAFMDSKRVNDRTDDDKTLVLATRIIADASPSLPESAT